MLRRFTTGLLFAAIAPASAQTAPALSAAARDSALTRMDSVWARSYATNDTATAQQLFADKLVVFASNGATKDKAGEMADVRPTAGLRMHHFTTRNVRTGGVGNLGLVTGDAEWAFEQGGQTRTVRRGYAASYLRGGPLGWRLASLRMTALPAANVATPMVSRDTVEALMAAMVTAFERDPTTVGRFYTDDAHIIGGGIRAAGRKQVDEYWADTKGLHAWTLTVLDVGGEAERPWMTGQSVLRTSNGRAMATDFVGFLARGADGQLRFAADVYAGTVPSRP